MSTFPTARPFPLEQGDHLTRDEFERRYDAMPGLKKAELIDGVVHMPSAVRWNSHASPHARVCAWLALYSVATPGTQAGDNGSVRLDEENEPQPDAALVILPSYGGQARVSADDYLEGAPELVFEVASSTTSIDLNAKLRVYQEHGVREYVVWRVLQRQIDWFVLRDGQFARLAAGADGVWRSEIFPGLWLDHGALVQEDIARVLAVLQQGLASPEHAAFVAQLQQAAAP
ncbi:MAG: Uma2 family endonuclease [Gemmataceae bacterium]